eukprot:TRINITY_DN7017_c0_g1_i1.p1 TRINITY_DN7017_c0_g1~~TRINITY_DN7017_c0_g1_i1.p1  ORF type:complete len:792 (+),score=118.58 TRINITY_DN7017_c0_g1_i1:58-2376(+)
MAACARHEDRHALGCASKKFSAVYSNPHTWKLISNYRWPGCIQDTSDAQKRLMKYVVSTRGEDQPDNWRLYFHLRSCLDTLCQYLDYQIDFNMWDDQYLEKFLDRPVTVLFSEPCPLDKDIKHTISPDIATNIARTTMADQNSFWGALFRLVVAVLVRRPSREVTNAVVRIMLRSLFSQGRAKPHVRFVLSLAIAKFTNIIVPAIADSGLLHQSYMGAICSCLNILKMHSDAVNVREIIAALWTQKLESCASDDEKIKCFEYFAQRGNLFRELTAAEAADGAATERYRDTLLSELSKQPRLETDFLTHAIHVCSTFPLNAKSLPAWRYTMVILLRHADDDTIRGSFVFISGHALFWNTKEPDAVRGFIALVLEELESRISSGIDSARAISISEATLRGLNLLLGPEVKPPILSSFTELPTVWPSKIQAIVDACSAAVVEDADKNPDNEVAIIASLLMQINEAVPQTELKTLRNFSDLRDRLIASTLKKLEQNKKLFLNVPDSLDISRLLSSAPTSMFTGRHLVSLVQLLYEIDAYELHKGIAFAAPLLLSLVMREDWHNLLDQLTDAEQKQMTHTVSICFALQTHPSPLADLLEVLANCQHFGKEAFNRFWEKVKGGNMLSPKYLLQILRVFSRYAIETPVDCISILQANEFSQLRRLFFCIPPTLESSDIAQDVSLRAMLAMLQTQNAADALLSSMKDEWRSDGGQAIESSSFSDADFVSAMMKPLPKDEPDTLIIAPPSLEEQRRWLQLIMATLPKSSSKVKMMVMMRLP